MGYSIGFRVATLASDQDVDLLPVVYDKEEQRNLLQSAIQSWQIAEGRSDVFERIEGGDKLLSAVIRCKNPSFFEEQEWRLVYAWNGWRPGTGPLGRKFRDTDKFMASYLEYGLPTIDGLWCKKTLHLDSIRCGPSAEPEKARASLQTYLWENGYKDVNVYSSEVPLRW
jgi:hypothetical protein